MMFLNTLRKKTKLLFVTAVVLNIAVVGMVVLTMYRIGEQETQIALLNGLIHEQQQSEEKLKSTRRLMVDTETERVKIDALFVSEDDIVGFIEKIESLGRHAGVSLELKSVDDSKTEDNVLSLRFTTNGNWESTFYFLALVESLPERIEVDGVNLRNTSRTEGGKTTPSWFGDFSISLLSFLKT